MRFAVVGCLLALAATASAQESGEDMEVVVVSGRQPGPPLWKITQGDHTLWILPLVSVVPRDLDWDDSRVAALIAASQEVIDPPGVSVGVSKMLLVNPVNWVRGPRLYKRLSRNPEGKSLHEVLRPADQPRYAALKQKYFPRDDDIEELRPAFAIADMSKRILKAERLTGARDIQRRVNRLVDRAHVKRNSVEIEEKVQGSFGELSARLEKLVESLPKDDELACFGTQLDLYERRLDDMKRVANAWATGNARDIENFSSIGELEDPCTRLLMASSEGDYMEELVKQSSARWLEAAGSALAHNESTFAVLPIHYVSGAMSLVDKLEKRGYMVHAPR